MEEFRQRDIAIFKLMSKLQTGLAPVCGGSFSRIQGHTVQLIKRSGMSIGQHALKPRVAPLPLLILVVDSRQIARGASRHVGHQ
jgi:hypothetical protein